MKILPIYSLLNRAISLRIATAQRCHAKCTELLASKDTYEIIDGYPEAMESMKHVFIKLPSMDPIGRNDLVVDFPSGMVDELESQFANYGNVRSGVPYSYLTLLNLFPHQVLV